MISFLSSSGQSLQPPSNVSVSVQYETSYRFINEDRISLELPSLTAQAAQHAQRLNVPMWGHDIRREKVRRTATPDPRAQLSASDQRAVLQSKATDAQYELLAIRDEVCRTSHQTRRVNDNLWAKESKLFITCLLFIMLNVSLLLNVLFIRDQTTYKSMSFPQNHECCFIYLFFS